MPFTTRWYFRYVGLAIIDIHTVYDRIFGDYPAKMPYIHRICMVLANP